MSAAPIEVRRIAPPSAEDFRRDYLEPQRPVVIEGAMESWPARRLWSADYFRTQYGQREIVVARTPGHRVEFSAMGGLCKDRLRFGDFLDRVEAGEPAGYMVSPVQEQIPELQGDTRVPDFCPRAPWYHSRFFLGPAGTVSPLHRDLPDNLFGQVVGRKRILLFPKAQARRMYAYPWYSQVPNYSQLDAEAPDLQRFPRFAKATPYVCTVGPGDLLFIPRLWWHQVRSLDFTVSINLWWAEGLVNLVVQTAILASRLRGLRW